MTNNELRELIVILSEATTKRQRLGSYSVEADTKRHQKANRLAQ